MSRISSSVAVRLLSLVVVASLVPAACQRAESKATAAPEARAGASASARPKRDPTQPPDDCPEGMAGIPGGTLVVDNWFDTTTASGVELRKEFPIAPHCLDKTEVTVAAMKECVTAKACKEPSAYVFVDPSMIDPPVSDFREKLVMNWKSPDMEKRLQHPINGVSYELAQAYCKYRKARLPSEWEIQWSMQGGTKKTLYPWGNEAPDVTRANLGDNDWLIACKKSSLCLVSPAPSPTIPSDGYGFTAPVGSFPKGANRWGVLDLVGNVAEWTSSEIGSEESGAAGVFTRGGSFESEVNWETKKYEGPRAVESRHRGGENPLPFRDGTPSPDEHMGMRCARDVSP